MARAAGALTVPLGDRFGLQADFSISTAPGYTLSAALHAFTRDPANSLLGVSAGFVKSSGALVLAAGPEGELYRDRVSVEGWAGVSMVDPVTPGPTRFGIFALGTLAYYPTDNWRVSVGLSSLDNYAALQVGSEYLFDNFELPVAVTGEARIGQDGAVRVLAGLRGYLGPDPHKSLIARHREDDPTDLSSALYAAAGRTTLYGNPAGDGPKKSAAGATASGSAAGDSQSGGDSEGNETTAENQGTGTGTGSETAPEWCTAHGMISWGPDPNNPEGGLCQDAGTFVNYHPDGSVT